MIPRSLALKVYKKRSYFATTLERSVFLPAVLN